MPVLLKYWKAVAVCLVVIALVVFAVWVRGVVADNAALKLQAQENQAKLDAKLKEIDNAIKLNREIADAVRNIKIRSNNYISAVEGSRPPVLHAGQSVLLVPGGVPQAVPSVFAALSSAR